MQCRGKSFSLVIYHHRVHVGVITGFCDCVIGSVYYKPCNLCIMFWDNDYLQNFSFPSVTGCHAICGSVGTNGVTCTSILSSSHLQVWHDIWPEDLRRTEAAIRPLRLVCFFEGGWGKKKFEDFTECERWFEKLTSPSADQLLMGIVVRLFCIQGQEWSRINAVKLYFFKHFWTCMLKKKNLPHISIV